MFRLHGHACKYYHRRIPFTFARPMQTTLRKTRCSCLANPAGGVVARDRCTICGPAHPGMTDKT
jgi:urease accessory protein UreH